MTKTLKRYIPLVVLDMAARRMEQKCSCSMDLGMGTLLAPGISTVMEGLMNALLSR